MRWRRWIGTILVCLISGAISHVNAEDARCFQPLANFSDRDPSNFSKIATPTTADPADGVVRFEVITSGKGKANIDFLYVTFAAPQGVSPAEFFKDIRLNFPKFAAGTAKLFGFGPYQATRKSNDAVGESNLKKWNSDQPFGALMTFNLDSAFPFAGIIGSGKPGAGRTRLIEKAGDVQVTCASSTDFIFSTVETKAGGMHPVAGNRGFGLTTSADGKKWTFYAEGVDRDSGSKWNIPIQYNPLSDDVFCKGENFWLSFFTEITAYLRDKRVQVIEWSVFNHGPVPYPFTAGQQPEATNCEADSDRL